MTPHVALTRASFALCLLRLTVPRKCSVRRTGSVWQLKVQSYSRKGGGAKRRHQRFTCNTLEHAASPPSAGPLLSVINGVGGRHSRKGRKRLSRRLGPWDGEGG